MKKSAIILTCVIAGASLIACTKETASFNGDKANLVPIVFSASMEASSTGESGPAASAEVKSALGPGATVVWTAGDAVSIFDNVSGKLASSFAVDIASSTISAQVSEGASEFHSLYPYDSGAEYASGLITTNFPAFQEAVAGSFGPGANLAVAHANVADPSLTFKNVGAIIKFTLAMDDVVAVSLKGNSDEHLAGKIKVDYNGGVPSHTVVNAKNVVTLRKKDGTALENGGVYYFAVLPANLSNGFTLNFTKKDGTTGYKKGNNPLTLTRNKNISLGTISDMTAYSSNYDAYQGGATFSIAGELYNRTRNGDATLLDSAVPENAVLHDNISGKKGVFFMKGTAPFTNPESTSVINKQVVLINDHTDGTPVTVHAAKNLNLRQGASFIAKDITFDLSSQYLLNNGGAAEDAAAEKLYFDGCSFINTVKPVALFSSKLKNGISSLRVVNCRFNCTNAGVSFFNCHDNSRMDLYKEVLVENNVFYAASPITNIRVFSYNAKETIPQTATEWPGSMTLKNNIFYNVSAKNGLMRQFKVASLQIGGNIYERSDADHSKSYYIFSADQDKSVIANTGDILYNTGTGTWVYSGNGNGQPLGVTNALTSLESSPFVSFDTAGGTYVLKPEYSSYGPQK